MNSVNDAETEAARTESRKGIKAKVQPLNALGATVTQCKEQHARAVRALAEYVVRADSILHPPPHEMTWHVMIVTGVLVLWMLDCIVAGNPAAHLVRRAFPYVPVVTEILTTAARLVVPALIIAMELLLGSLVYRYGSQSPHRNRLLQLAAAVAGIGIAAAVTTMALMLDLAGQAVSGQEHGSLGFHQIVYYALAAVTLLLRLVVLFLSRPGAAAKDFVVAKLTARKLRKAEAKAKRPYQQHDATFVALAISYLQAVKDHFDAFGEKVPYGPFTETTQALLHEHFPHIFPPVTPKHPPGLPTTAQKSPSSTWHEDDDVIDAEVIPTN